MEFDRRARLLYEMQRRRIYDFNKTQQIINQYHKDPITILESFGIIEKQNVAGQPQQGQPQQPVQQGQAQQSFPGQLGQQGQVQPSPPQQGQPQQGQPQQSQPQSSQQGQSPLA